LTFKICCRTFRYQCGLSGVEYLILKKFHWFQLPCSLKRQKITG